MTWYACAEPERRPDAGVLWHLKCSACYLKAHADASQPDISEHAHYLRSLTAALIEPAAP